ncbi:MAG: hypothetical protein ORN51_07110 [Akkermansiaceae bacterium]|nr:hypothetical protein [Akkermansiaceae bacterium]
MNLISGTRAPGIGYGLRSGALNCLQKLINLGSARRRNPGYRLTEQLSGLDIGLDKGVKADVHAGEHRQLRGSVRKGGSLF